MPKGVEHLDPPPIPDLADVSSSVMPKGVEHTAIPPPPAQALPCVEFSDAERR